MKQAAIRTKRMERLAVVINECFEADLDSILMTDLMDLFHDGDVHPDMEFRIVQSFTPFVTRTVLLPTQDVRKGNRVRQALVLGSEASRFVFDQLGIDTGPNLEMMREVNGERGEPVEDGEFVEFEPMGDPSFTCMQHEVW